METPTLEDQLRFSKIIHEKLYGKQWCVETPLPRGLPKHGTSTAESPNYCIWALAMPALQEMLQQKKPGDYNERGFQVLKRLGIHFGVWDGTTGTYKTLERMTPTDIIRAIAETLEKKQ